MSHDDDVEWAKFIKGLIWEGFQARTIRDMEDRLQGTSSLLGAPMPNTCHPALSHQADFVRNFNQHVVQILGVLPKAMRAYRMGAGETYPAEEVMTKRMILTRQTIWAPAPFVGDPRYEIAGYVWSAWLDDYKRHICSDAKLEWRRL